MNSKLVIVLGLLFFVSLVLAGKKKGYTKARNFDYLDQEGKIHKVFGYGPKDSDYDNSIVGGNTHRKWGVTVPLLSLGYVGRGYDIYFGNPKETNVGGDQGYRQPVFVMDTSGEIGKEDWRNVKPENVDVSARLSCSLSRTTSTVSTSTALQSQISKSIKSEKTVTKKKKTGTFFAKKTSKSKTKFTQSKSFKSMSEVLSEGKKKMVFSEAECSVYEAQVNRYQLPKFQETFKKAVLTLPEEYTSSANPKFEKFVKTYGTHIVLGGLFGSRYGKVYEIESNSLSSSQSQEKKFESSVEKSKSSGGSFLGMGGGGKKKTKKTNSGRDASASDLSMSSVASNEWSYSIGAPMSEDLESWVQESETQPALIQLKLDELDELIFNHLDEKRGLALRTYLSTYEPPAAAVPQNQIGKCYVKQNHHTSLTSYKAPKSIIATCKDGHVVMGGTFGHLWNMHGDVVVNSAATQIKELKGALEKYNRLRNEQLELNFLMEKGSKMIEKYANDETIRNLKKTFSDRVDPDFIRKFLAGKLDKLGIQQKEALTGIANGMKAFGKGGIGGMVDQFLKGNPYTNSIFRVSDSLVKELKDTVQSGTKTLSEDDLVLSHEDLEEYSDSEHATIQEHTDILLSAIQEIDNLHGTQFLEPEQTESLIFGQISKWMQAAHHHISKHIQVFAGLFPKHVSNALQKWGNFMGDFDSLWKKFQHNINSAKNRHTNVNLFQDIMKHVKSSAEHNHGSTLLAKRNSLSWLFPYGERRFVCGSGNLGTKSTRRSSFGYCTAYCCDAAEEWDMATVDNSRKTVSKVKQTASIIAKCPKGYSVLSGGFLINGYHPNRFVQVTEQSFVDDDAFKCEVKWTETEHIPEVPQFKCYARCAKNKGPTLISCKTVEQTLVNGHGTAACPAGYQAFSGGWKVSSPGVTYFKKTGYENVHPFEGASGVRTEFGTSHEHVVGSSYARCCLVASTGVEEAVTQVRRRCHNHLERNYESRGSKMGFSSILGFRNILESTNGKFIAKLTYDYKYQVYLGIYELFGCSRPRLLDRIRFPTGQCLKDVEDKKGGGVSYSHFFKKFLHGFKSGYRSWGKRLRYERQIRKLMLRVTSKGLAFYKEEEDNPCSEIEWFTDELNEVKLADNGDLVFYDDNKKALRTFEFSRCRPLYRQIKAKKSILHSGEMLTLGQGLRSQSRNYILKVEEGGALTIYRQRKSKKRCVQPQIIFSTANIHGKMITDPLEMEKFNKNEQTGWVLRLNEDNNLVLYDENGKSRWQSSTSGLGLGPGIIQVKNNGAVELLDTLEHEYWNLQDGKLQECELIRESLKLRTDQLGVGEKFNSKVGGLVSENQEYVMHVRMDATSSQPKPMLEIWHDGSRIGSTGDCSPSRFCTLAHDVAQVELTKAGMIGIDGRGQKKTLFALKNGFQLEKIHLTDAGHLMALGSKGEHRIGTTEQILLGTCQTKHETVKKDSSDPYHCGNIKVLGKFGLNDQYMASCPLGYHLKGWTTVGTTSLTNVAYFSCCKTPGVDSSNVECKELPFNFGQKGTVSCPDNYVVNGFATSGSTIDKLKTVKCCKAKEVKSTASLNCYKENLWSSSEKPGEKICNRKGYFMNGLYREACNHLKCIREFKCCQVRPDL